jgi:hypothetical protein
MSIPSPRHSVARVSESTESPAVILRWRYCANCFAISQDDVFGFSYGDFSYE